ncbi:hypothetical protein C0J52_01365 [Blattella germanica]|nr:hypothetical protein C0J52_01365 [Blattella germanica]
MGSVDYDMRMQDKRNVKNTFRTSRVVALNLSSLLCVVIFVFLLLELANKVVLWGFVAPIQSPLKHARGRRLPEDSIEGQCGQYSVPTGGLRTGAPTSTAAIKNIVHVTNFPQNGHGSALVAACADWMCRFIEVVCANSFLQIGHGLTPFKLVSHIEPEIQDKYIKYNVHQQYQLNIQLHDKSQNMKTFESCSLMSLPWHILTTDSNLLTWEFTNKT